MILFFFFLIVDLYCLIPAIITLIFNYTAKVVVPTRIPTNEAKTEMKTYPVTVEIKISKCSV